MYIDVFLFILYLTDFSVLLSPGVDELHQRLKDQIILVQIDHFRLDETKLGLINPVSDQFRKEQTKLFDAILGSSRRPVPVSYPGN